MNSIFKSLDGSPSRLFCLMIGLSLSAWLLSACTSTRGVQVTDQKRPSRAGSASMERFGEMTDIDISGSMIASAGYSDGQFRDVIVNAVPIANDDPTLKEWNFAPFYFGSFKLEGEDYRFDLFLGGLGKIVEPDGRTLYFRYRR